MNTTPDLQVYLIDDDAAFRKSVIFLLESVGWAVKEYAGAQSFLEDHASPPDDLGCLLLDIRMPSLSGLALQQHVLSRGWQVAIVFMTGHGDVEMAVQAMKAGACDFIEKPFKDQALLDAVDNAMRCTRERQSELSRQNEAQNLLERLSPREREVARLVALGDPNKVIAHKLGISEKTVHVHRQHVLEKTQAANAAELTRLMLTADSSVLD